MTIDSFFTSKLQTKAGLVPGSEKALPSAGSAVDFFEFLLARTLKAQTEELNSVGVTKKDEDKSEGLFGSKNHKLLQSPNPLLDPDPALRASDLIAAKPEIAQDVQNHALDAQDEIAQTLALNVKAFLDFLKPAESGDALTAQKEALEKAAREQKIPGFSDSYQLGDAALPKNLLAHLQSLLAKLESLGGEQIQLANLDAAGLENVKAKIKALLASQKALTAETSLSDTPRSSDLKKLDTESEGFVSDADAVLAEIVIGVVQILPAAGDSQKVTAHEQAIGSHVLSSSAPAASELASRLNRLTPGAQNSDTTTGLPHEISAETDSFDSLLQEASNKAAVKAAGKDKIETAMIKAEPHPPGPTAGRILESWPFGASGSLFGSLEWASNLIDPYGAAAVNGSSISSPANFISLVTQASAAPFALPGTQIIAKAIQKMAEGGETRTITLQMDPPDLGRVKVQMIFGKDKTVKTTILAEKPETFAMLQRDSHNLERALSQAGLDADGSSIEFQLAGDNQDFGHNGGHDGSRGGFSGKAEADEIELIETTMTWRVDPDTGHMRYDIFA